MAEKILSPEQKHALESTYTFLAGAVPFLQSIDDRLQPDEKLIAANLRELSTLAQRKLAEAFPELLVWLREWERGGVR